jgi:hypothetical protein
MKTWLVVWGYSCDMDDHMDLVELQATDKARALVEAKEFLGKYVNTKGEVSRKVDSAMLIKGEAWPLEEEVEKWKAEVGQLQEAYVQRVGVQKLCAEAAKMGLDIVITKKRG